MIGTNVGSYKVTEALATGGMGVVFVAKHTVMGRDAVVKLLLPALSHDEEMVRRFFNEARAAASINDPGIVQIFDVGFLPDHRAYIVMERLRGETLAHRMRSRGVTVEQCVHILRLLARSLDAAHEHAIVHRDLKPDNIFLVPDRDVAGGERTKILDFGIAKLAGANPINATQAGSIFGTPAYMAPEQCSDAATVDARADLYALGCIAYEMLCGQPPFGNGGIELLASHLRDVPVAICQRNPETPEWLAAVVHRLLGKSPSDRYLSAAALYAALDPTGGPEATAATMAPPPLAAVERASTPRIASQATPLTTHSAAAGMVTSAATTPPPSSGRLALIVGGLVIAAGAAVTTVILATRNTAVSAVVEPRTSTNLLAAAERATGAERWDDAIGAASSLLASDPEDARAKELLARAKAELGNRATFDAVMRDLQNGNLLGARQGGETIPQTSVYRARARAALGEADAAARAKADAVVVAAPRHDPRHGQTLAPPPRKSPAAGSVTPPALVRPPTVVPLAPTPPRPPDDERPAATYEESITRARDDLAARQYAGALKHGQAALRARSGDGEALMIATIASCGMGNATAAREYLPKERSSYRDLALHRCEVLGKPLE